MYRFAPSDDFQTRHDMFRRTFVSQLVLPSTVWLCSVDVLVGRSFSRPRVFVFL